MFEFTVAGMDQLATDTTGIMKWFDKHVLQRVEHFGRSSQYPNPGRDDDDSHVRHHVIQLLAVVRVLPA